MQVYTGKRVTTQNTLETTITKFAVSQLLSHFEVQIRRRDSQLMRPVIENSTSHALILGRLRQGARHHADPGAPSGVVASPSVAGVFGLTKREPMIQICDRAGYVVAGNESCSLDNIAESDTLSL